jgi:V8-like Glu-specific endopeptidase
MDFGVVTKKIGGGITKEPASEDVERALKKQNGATPLKRSGAPTFQGAVETAPTGPTPKTVFGVDDRVRIRYVTEYPFRAIGMLLITLPGRSKATVTCSATLIGTRYVLTAAHCLFDEESGQFVDAVRFFPGLDSVDHAPNGYYDAAEVTVLAGYANAQSKSYDYEHMLHDMGVVRLSKNAGRALGWLAYGYDDNLSPFTANIVGYPGDMPYGTMWRASCNVDPIEGAPNLFETECDTYPGSSGASVYDFDKDTKDRTVYAVNVAQNPSFNVAVRVTGPYYCWLQGQTGGRC